MYKHFLTYVIRIFHFVPLYLTITYLLYQCSIQTPLSNFAYVVNSNIEFITFDIAMRIVKNKIYIYGILSSYDYVYLWGHSSFSPLSMYVWQQPPAWSCCSSTNTFFPVLERMEAVVNPPIPLPITIASQLSSNTLFG